MVGGPRKAFETRGRTNIFKRVFELCTYDLYCWLYHGSNSVLLDTENPSQDFVTVQFLFLFIVPNLVNRNSIICHFCFVLAGVGILQLLYSYRLALGQFFWPVAYRLNLGIGAVKQKSAAQYVARQIKRGLISYLYLKERTFRAQYSGDLSALRGEGHIFENNPCLHASGYSLKKAARFHLNIKITF